ncbi:MAG: extracellular solute-binding protein [Phycisphaerae bacterium]
MSRGRRGVRATFHGLVCLLSAGAAAAVRPARAAESATVTIYCSADEAIARPLLAEFTRATGVVVRPLFDTEAGKTTGLVHRLMAERERPRADVWWSSELFGTIQLAEAGVLAAYEPKSAADIPASFRDPQHRWTAFGARGRVIAYDPKRVAAEALPRRWADLARPEYRGRVALANPLFGTTRGQVAVQSLLWGEPACRAWLAALGASGARVADGNSQSVLLVTRGTVDFGATDTDDVLSAQQRGESVAMLFPDLDSPHGRSRPGTLWIPNSVALVRGGPSAAAGQRLVEWLASAEMERRLAESESGNVPVRGSVAVPGADAVRRAYWQQATAEMRRSAGVDYAAAAARLRPCDEMVRETLLH